jgi:hypothetical protein
MKACKGCHKEFQFKDYEYIGLERKKNTKKPTIVMSIIRKFTKKPYTDHDSRKLYPTFD